MPKQFARLLGEGASHFGAPKDCKATSLRNPELVLPSDKGGSRTKQKTICVLFVLSCFTIEAAEAQE